MEIYKPNVGNLIVNPDITYSIPPYQRSYSWESDRWQTLIQDILKKVTSPENVSRKHWMGIIMTTKSQEHNAPRGYMHSFMEIIDGQQRIVTLRLWLQAVLDHAAENNILIAEESNLKFAEIICQETDRIEMQQVLNGEWRQRYKTYKPGSSGLLHCYTYFRWVLWLGDGALLGAEPDRIPNKSNSEADHGVKIEELWERELTKRQNYVEDLDEESYFQLQINRTNQPNLDELIKVTISDLSLVELQIERERDEEPAEIFEALNGKRLQLFQFDHVRNFIFSGISEIPQRKQLYDGLWKHSEVALGKSKQTMKSADLFLYDFLISRGETRYQKSFKKDRTSNQFNRYFETRSSGNHAEVAEKVLLPNLASWLSIKSCGETFDIGSETYSLESNSKRSLRLLEALSSGPMVPILMNITNRHFEGRISADSLFRQIFAFEKLLGRKVLNRVGLSPLRAEMMVLAGRLGPEFLEDDLIAELAALAPSDRNIEEKLLPYESGKLLTHPETALIAEPGRKGSLNARQLLAIFQAIETKSEGTLRNNLLESDAEEKFSIEHIYPKEPLLWRDELRQWAVSPAQLAQRLHTIGNLGVIPKRLNSKLSNKSFREKREIMRNGENHVPKLGINAFWVRDAQAKWTPEDIDARARQLIAKALAHWSF